MRLVGPKIRSKSPKETNSAGKIKWYHEPSQLLKISETATGRVSKKRCS